MTSPEHQPLPQAQPSLPEALGREVEAIDVDELDKQNEGWTKQYLAQLQERLADEQAAAAPDLVMIAYLKREVATYQELLTRTDGK